MFGLPIACLARPAITVLLLFIVYLVATFDYSLCRQKLVFVVLSPGQLPPATKNASGSLPAAELRDKLPSTPAVTQHTGWAHQLHMQQWDLTRRAQGVLFISENTSCPHIFTPGGGLEPLQVCSVPGDSPEVSTFHRREGNLQGLTRDCRGQWVIHLGYASDRIRCWSLGHCVNLESLNPLQIHTLGCPRGQDSLSFIGAK